MALCPSTAVDAGVFHAMLPPMTELYSLHRVTVTAPGEPLFAALATAITGLTRHKARLAITGGLVKVGGTPVHGPKHVLGEGVSRIECDLRHGIKAAYHAKVHDSIAPHEKPFTALYQDRDVIVIDKRAGVVSAPNKKGPGEQSERGHVPELVRRMAKRQGHDLRFIGVVHRLDKETSGCLCLALNRSAQRLLSEQFASHSAARTYRCLVARAPHKDQDTIRGKLGHGRDGRRRVVGEDETGKESVTHYTVLRRFTAKAGGRDMGAELEVTLETGRTHQIRISLSAIGCPVYGDPVYGERGLDSRGEPGPKAPRLMLHAFRLALDHPSTGERLELEAPIPREFHDFVKLLG